MPTDPTMMSSTQWSRRKQVALLAGGVLLAWAALAYVVAPALWRGYVHRHPALDDIPGITHTAAGIPADPVNVAFVGTKADLVKIVLAAKWYPADPLSLKSCLEIAEATVFKRPYDDAPVSSLYLFGRKEDLAFEQPVGDNPRERHHVRFWKSDKIDSDGRPIWVGAAVFDKGVGLSHTTGQITHHTSSEVDAERDYLVRCLEATGDLTETEIVYGFHKTRSGKNGGGDPWTTDGNLIEGILALK